MAKKKQRITLRVTIDKITLRVIREVNCNLKEMIRLLKLNGQSLIQLLDRSMKVV
ncbi:MAG: hypothetical protein WBW16_09360 [Bacteroidota bacterium]